MAMTEEQGRVLRERYADCGNRELARELGVGKRTLERWAEMLGLKKSEERKREAWKETGRKNGDRMRGVKKGPGEKGERPWRWKKGHRWGEEVERKRVAALQELAAEERRRLRMGLDGKTAWKMNRKNWISEKK